MKYIRKILAPMLCVLILASMCCFSAFAATDDGRLPTTRVNSVKESDYVITIYGIEYTVPAKTIVGYNHTTTGPYVTTAQRALNNVNGQYDDANCSCGRVDATFGDKTWQAAYNFQEWANLDPDGIIGPDTWGKLKYYCR